MARSAFYSFHFQVDAWRASKVRNMGVVDGSQPARDNDWETIKKGGDKAIQAWIDGQLKGTSCAIVLVGPETAGRKWIKYEIEKAWSERKGLMGIRIHGITDKNKNTATAGRNPFSDFTVEKNGLFGKYNKSLADIVPLHDPFGWDSPGVYSTIKSNIEDWIEEAIKIRGEN